MDEVAQLGHVDEFVAAQTLLRGYGVQIWSFWQDLSQLQAVYPNIWPTIINNCKVFQAFGCATPMMARAMEDIFMVPAATILDLEKDELILSIYGDEPVIARKPQYYSDPVFRGQFSSNPLFGDLPNSTDGKDAVENFIEMPSKIVRKFEFKVKKRKRFISN
jgi:type IV secretion system protein VirD4